MIPMLEMYVFMKLQEVKEAVYSILASKQLFVTFSPMNFSILTTYDNINLNFLKSFHNYTCIYCIFLYYNEYMQFIYKVRVHTAKVNHIK